MKRLASALDVPTEIFSWFAYTEVGPEASCRRLFGKVEALMLREVELCVEVGPEAER